MPSILKGPLRGTYDTDKDDLIVGVKLGELREMNDFIATAMIVAMIEEDEPIYKRAKTILDRKE